MINLHLYLETKISSGSVMRNKDFFLTSYFDYIVCTTSSTQKCVKTALESILIDFLSFYISFLLDNRGRDSTSRSTINIARHVARGPLYSKRIVHHCSRYLEKEIIESRHIPSYVVHCGSPWGAPFSSRLFFLFSFFAASPRPWQIPLAILIPGSIQDVRLRGQNTLIRLQGRSLDKQRVVGIVTHSLSGCAVKFYSLGLVRRWIIHELFHFNGSRNFCIICFYCETANA